MSAPAACARPKPGDLWAPAHLCALAAFGVVQPALDLLGRHPPFLAAHRADAGLLGGAVLVLAAVIPLLVWLLGRALAAFPAARAVLFHALLWSCLQPIGNRLMPESGYPLALAAAGVAAGSWAYRRSPPLRMALGLLAVSPLVLAAAFLADDRMRPYWTAAAAAPAAAGTMPAGTSMVVVLFDELPLLSLLDADGAIDGRAFPNFARLAAQSTLYPRAVSVAAQTVPAVTAFHTATYPGGESHARDRNLFQLFGAGTLFDVDEQFTDLCPENLCARRSLERNLPRRLASFFEDLSAVYLHALLPKVGRGWLPELEGTWMGFWRRAPSPDSTPAAKLRHRLAALSPASAGSRLVFQHVLLPHFPFDLLPGGQRYDKGWFLQFDVHEGQPAWERLQIYQRHLLQVQAVDGLVGALLDRLAELDLWDRSWVVVLADHGASLRPGRLPRGGRDAATLRADVLPIPLFIKAPQQATGAVDEAPVELVDVLPMVLGRMGISVPWPHDGLADPSSRAPGAERLAEALRIPRADWDAQAGALSEALAWKHGIPGMDLHAGDFFAISPRPDLYLRPARPTEPSAHAALLWGDAPWIEYQPGAELVDTFLLADLVLADGEAPPSPGAVVAVVLGGVVRAVAPVGPQPRLRLSGRQWRERHPRPDAAGELFFSCVLDPRWLRSGRNEVELALVEPGPAGDRWRRLRVEAMAKSE